MARKRETASAQGAQIASTPRSRLRVAHLFLGRRGGGASYSLELAKALSARCELRAFVSRYAENLEGWKESGVAFEPIATYRGRGEFIRSTLMASEIRRLAGLVRDMRPDVVYYPMVHMWTPIVNVLLRPYPKVLTVHDPNLWKERYNVGLALAQWAAVRQSDRFILLAQALKEEFCCGGVDETLVDVVPHGEFSCYRTLEEGSTGNGASAQPTLLFFGAIRPYKGLSTLLKAFPLVRRRRPDARLLVVGKGNLAAHRRELDRLGNVEVVNEWVPSEAISTWFERASVLVAPYTTASQSGVIPLAYAHSVPVVATRVGGLPDQVRDGETGVLVPPEDAHALAEACLEMLENPVRARGMGQRGREMSESEWSWDRVADEVLRTLRTVTGTDPAGFSPSE